MRPLIFTAGILTLVLGFVAHSAIGDPAVFQGALTLGGGWIICGLFSFNSRWHGIIGAGVLALLAAARCAPALRDLLVGRGPATPFQLAAFLISMVVLVAVVRNLRAERARRQLAEMKAPE